MGTRETFRAAVSRVAAFAPALNESPAFAAMPAPPNVAAAASGRRYNAAPPAAGGATLAGAVRALAAGEGSAAALLDDALAAIARHDRELNAFTYLRPEAELQREARLLDDEIRRGERRGPLHGIPITVKDVIHVRDMPTSASSRVLDGTPEQRDASAVERLRQAGALLLGKTGTHEFALGVTMPQSRNPWDPARLAGGSSGGSAIALAIGACLGSLGTDTRASIRVPAALCGLVGYKPTFGLIPTDGVVTLSWSMDHLAPMAKTVEDVCILLDVLAPSVDGAGSFRDAISAPVDGLRVGVPRAGMNGATPAVAGAFEQALSTLRALGATLHELDQPAAEDLELANAAGLIVSRVEAAAYHRPWRGRREHYTDDVGEQLDEALGVLAVDYVQGQRYRADLRRRMARLFDEVDILAMPTSKVPAPLPEESEAMLLVLSENCVPWSFIGFPAISLPCGKAPVNLPIGLELIGAPYRDRTVLALAAAFEAAARISYV